MQTKIIIAPDLLLVTALNVNVSAVCKETLLTAMEQLGMDSVCPLMPVHHRKHGIYECNRYYSLGRVGVELVPDCIVIKDAIYDKYANFDDWFAEYAANVAIGHHKHALICNAILYNK